MSDLKTREGLRFHALRNALYHTARRRWLEAANRIVTFLIILLGTAAAANASRILGDSAADVWLGVATAALGAIQLVFDFGGRARTHQVLQQKYYDILARVEAMAADDQKEICQLSGDMVRIYADEPPIADVPDAVAYNAAAKALGSSDEECFKISKWTRIAATLFPFFPFRLRTHSEIAKDCAKAHG
ncbi:hypothetical protein [Xanthobacter sp. ZOL 2024]